MCEGDLHPTLQCQKYYCSGAKSTKKTAGFSCIYKQKQFGNSQFIALIFWYIIS